MSVRDVFLLCGDLYGVAGGIAQFNRDLIDGFVSDTRIGEIVVVPRNSEPPPAELDSRVRQRLASKPGRLRFACLALQCALRVRWSRRQSVVICAHINLLPLAVLCARIMRAPLVLGIYGIDVWQPPRSRWAGRSTRKVDCIYSISELTLDRFQQWAVLKPEVQLSLLPNSVRTDCRRESAVTAHELRSRYGLTDHPVIMTMGRLVSRERAKGFDAVLDAMPLVLEQRHDVIYVIAGDGPDRARLEQRVIDDGLAGAVRFIGYVQEPEKQCHYELADTFVLASEGEGFGFVLLEAMAEGTPVIASTRDGGREALCNGSLGELVDPRVPEDVAEAILSSLKRPRRVPPGLEFFATGRFNQRVRAMLSMVEHIQSTSGA